MPRSGSRRCFSSIPKANEFLRGRNPLAPLVDHILFVVEVGATMKRYLVVLLLLLARQVWGATYYVDSSCTDTNIGSAIVDGTAYDPVTPACTGGSASYYVTISDLVQKSFAAGDTILFRRGQIWKGNLWVTSSGSAGSPITWGAFGSGDKPIITAINSLKGWDNASKWSVLRSNVYQFSLSVDPTVMWFNGTRGQKAQNVQDIDSAYNWYWNSSDNVLSVYSTSNPASAFSIIEINSLVRAITVDKKHYHAFSSLDIRGGSWESILFQASDGITIDKCNIGWGTGGNGITVQSDIGVRNTSDNGVVSNNIIDSGDRKVDDWYNPNPADGVVLRAGVSGWRVYNNTIKDWGHSGIYIINNVNATYPTDNNLIYNNTITAPDVDYGRGIGADAIAGAAHGNKVYNNIIKDTTIRNQINMEGLEFYYNIIDNVAGTALAGHSGVGQCLTLEGYSSTVPRNMKIYNNVFANCAEPGIMFSSGSVYISGNLIINNIFYNNGRASQIGIDNYQLYISGSATILGNIITNNLFYKSGVTDLIFYGHSATNDSPHTVAEFNAENGTASDVISGNITGDPMFVSSNDFNLQPNSPAIDKGTSVGLTIDYAGNSIPRGGALDIGAYEFMSATTQSSGTGGGGCSISPDGKSKGESPLGTLLAVLSPGILLIWLKARRKRQNSRQRFAKG